MENRINIRSEVLTAIVWHRVVWMVLIIMITEVGNSQQTPLHILLKEIKDDLPEAEVFRMKQDLFFRLVKEKYPSDTLIAYCEPFYAYCIASKHYDAAAEVAGILSSKYNAHRNDPDASLQIMQAVKQYEHLFKDPYSTGTIYGKIGGIYFNQGRMDSALMYYQRAIPHFSIQNKLSEADMHFFSGQAYANLDSLAQGSQSFTKSYEIYKEKGDSVYMAEALSEQASLFSKNRLHDEAFTLMDQSDAIATVLQLHSRLATNDKNRAQIYHQSQQYALEKQYLEKAYKHAQHDPNSYYYLTYRIWCSLVHNQIRLEQMDTAKIYLDSIEAHLDYHEKNPSTKIHYLITKLEYLTALKRFSPANSIAQELAYLLEKQDIKEQYAFAIEVLMTFYSAQKKLKNALDLAEKRLTLQRNKTKNVLENQLAYYQIQFDISAKNYQIENQKLRIDHLAHQQSSLKKQALLGLGLLTALFLAFYFRRSRKAAKKEADMQQRFANQLIEQQEYEKKSVSEALHDSIGQSLLLIKNKIHLDRDDQAKSLLNDTILELSEISRSLHPVQVKQLGLTKAIQKNIDQVDRASDTYFSTEIDDIDDIFTERQELHIYRIVQELLTNVIKHAQATACKISVTNTDSFINMEIKDNGIGFDFTQEFDKIDSLGLKTMKSRISDLQAQFIFDSTPGTGTRIEIIVPKNPAL